MVANPDSTAAAATIGSCATSAGVAAGTAVDSVVVTSGSGANPPVICGFNSGQHGKYLADDGRLLVNLYLLICFIFCVIKNIFELKLGML